MPTINPHTKSRLGRYRLLAPTAGVKVSPLCLGTMNFGNAWKETLGECTKDTTFSVLDAFYKNGGNFIDTANNYQDEVSEIWLGEWMETRGVRDQIVLATKYSSAHRLYNQSKIQANFVGNNTKSLRVSEEASLRKLRTDYIDLFYVHWWDFGTSIEEVMTSLNQLVLAGKVLYLGISDTPAWVVSRANQYARDHGMRTFSVYQGQWNAAKRDFERDIIPMCHAEGMGICPWGALGSGSFKSASEREQLSKSQSNTGRKCQPRPIEVQVSHILEDIAARHSTVVTSVALAYVMHKVRYVYPIVGGRLVDQLLANIDALGLVLSEKDMRDIESGYEFDP
ncbi:Norsolorinic acid reductase B [Penicillium crustosum]|uniref:Norsolorinic acid reductase B n=1 Tax=Penicillium crustosum TaxID=36656 RepID=UPI002397FABB|nr:Norsolorinic acid reductase B [Penicillium crustosum]KAJ5396268.1 Norsolorinic acid reductase B [Penicillium crustosum]